MTGPTSHQPPVTNWQPAFAGRHSCLDIHAGIDRDWDEAGRDHQPRDHQPSAIRNQPSASDRWSEHLLTAELTLRIERIFA